MHCTIRRTFELRRKKTNAQVDDTTILRYHSRLESTEEDVNVPGWVLYVEQSRKFRPGYCKTWSFLRVGATGKIGVIDGGVLVSMTGLLIPNPDHYRIRA